MCLPLTYVTLDNTHETPAISKEGPLRLACGSPQDCAVGAGLPRYFTARVSAQPNCLPSDDAEQPEDQDQDQKTAETDIHGMISLFGFDGVTVIRRSAFHSFRFRSDQR
jgi:hypothetical protein